MMRSLAFAALLAAGALLPLSLDAGCSGKTIQQGGLMVVFETDGSLPQADRMHFEFQSPTGDKVYWNQDYAITSLTPLPTTIAIATNGDPNATVLINASLWAGGTLLDDRQNQVIEIPTSRVAQLAIVFSANCTPEAVAEADGGAGSKCAQGETCDPQSGGCTSGVVSGTTLPTFEPDGGAEASAPSGDSSSADASSGTKDGGTSSEDGGMDAFVPPSEDGGSTKDGGSQRDGSVAPCLPGLTCNVACADGGTTTISGTVYDPAGRNPLYGVTVYVPAQALPTLPSGVPTGSEACSCSALYPSSISSVTTTGVDGTFRLQNVPVGTGVPLVLQTGKWRRKLTITTTACQDNAQADKSLAFLGTLSAGTADDNIPDIAVSTGAADTLECVLSRIGLDASEYVAGSATTGHVHLFSGGGTSGKENVTIAGSPMSNLALWDSEADLLRYDYVLLSCEGYETFDASPAVLEQYANAGGRVLASHFHYAWFTGSMGQGTGAAAYSAPADWGSNLATWSTVTENSPVGAIGTIPTESYPGGLAFGEWLTSVGALGDGGVPAGELPVYEARFNANVTSANVHSQTLLTDDSAAASQSGGFNTMAFTFGTPVNAPVGADGGAPNYCGRIAYTDVHVTGDTSVTADSTTAAPPSSCAQRALSPQEEAIEFMIFDTLVGPSCVTP